MARMDYPDVTADPVGGRSLAQRMIDALPSGVTEISYDTEALLGQAGMWQAKANELRELAARAREITEWAKGAAGDFKGEYEPDGVYDTTYTDCLTGAQRIEEETLKAADSIEGAAQAIRWAAENMEEVQRMAATRTESIDADVSGAGEGDSGAGESARRISVLDDGGSAPATEGDIYEA